MQDLIPKNTGNSRFLKTSLASGTSWASALAMLRAGTFPVDLAGINAAGVDQQGTPLNKGNLLADATETAIWGDTDNRTVNQALSALSAAKLAFVQAFKTAGSFTWTCPVDGDYIALIIGGGGSGGSRSATTGSPGGGAAGYVNFYFGSFSKGNTAALVVGAGGAAATNAGGNTGGSSAFAGVTASGGDGGQLTRGTADSYGGQSPGGNAAIAPYGGVSVAGILSGDLTTVLPGTPIPACFVGENGAPISCLCAGGYANRTSGGALTAQPVITLPNGNRASPGVAVASGTASSVTPTDPGVGSGAVVAAGGATSGRGAAGLVAIYRVMGGAA